MKKWINGIFHTMEKPGAVKHQMATDQGLIVGFDDDIDGIVFDEIIDLKGAHIYPGFVDAHLHLLGYGRMLSRPNLNKIKDKDQVIAILEKAYQDKPLFAEGYFECGLTKSDLNQISNKELIMVRHNDYHSLTVNDAVLNMMDYESEDGVLTEESAEQAMRLFPPHTFEDLKDFLKKSIQKLNAFGITGGHSDDLSYYNSFDETLSVFDEVLNVIPFRTHLLVHHHVLDDFLKSGRTYMDQTPYLQLGSIKMFYDGTVSSKTALMKAPYRNTDMHGLRIHEKLEFERMIQKVRAHHLTAAIHVIGDQGVLEVIEILKKYPPKQGQFDRLIHTPWMDQKTPDYLKGMALSIDIQPQFLSSDLPWAFDYFEKTPELVFPWKTLLDHNIILAGSSDAPIEIPNPLLGIRALVYRISDHDHKAYGLKEAIPIFDAIKLYTTSVQFSTMKSNRGYLKKGYIADLTGFEKDLEKLSEPEFETTKVLWTIIDEKVVFQKEK